MLSRTVHRVVKVSHLLSPDLAADLANILLVAPFVGHNAFLRWEALQECSFVDPDDGNEKIWSEDHVSEDFQIAISLQCKVSDPLNSQVHSTEDDRGTMFDGRLIVVESSRRVCPLPAMTS